MAKAPPIHDPIDLWFRLRDGMFNEPGVSAPGARPPTLRDACYAHVLSLRTRETEMTPETIEAFVNGLELGAISVLRKAWEARPKT
jgi:hypothetical protein